MAASSASRSSPGHGTTWRTESGPSYREFCDALYFAVDDAFPCALLPDSAGLIVASGRDAEVVRPAPVHRLPPARRRALTQRFATVAATRLAALEDPAITASLRSALRVE